METGLLITLGIVCYLSIASWMSGYIMGRLKSPHYWEDPRTVFGGMFWPISILILTVMNTAYQHGKKTGKPLPQIRVVTEPKSPELMEAEVEVEHLTTHHNSFTVSTED